MDRIRVRFLSHIPVILGRKGVRNSNPLKLEVTQIRDFPSLDEIQGKTKHNKVQTFKVCTIVLCTIRIYS